MSGLFSQGFTLGWAPAVFQTANQGDVSITQGFTLGWAPAVFQTANPGDVSITQGFTLGWAPAVFQTANPGDVSITLGSGGLSDRESYGFRPCRSTGRIRPG